MQSAVHEQAHEVHPVTYNQAENMLYLSQIIIANQQFGSFGELEEAVKEYAREGERFFRMDVKPPYFDTPDDWEDRLEASFSGLSR
jgi:hypothetical protein